MARNEQNTTNVNIPNNEEDLDKDEFAQTDFEDDDIDFTRGEEEVKQMSSKVNLSRNGMLIALAVVAILIAVVLFSGKLNLPKLSFLGGDGEKSEGIASGILGSYDEAAEEKKAGSEEEDVATLIIRDLQDYYPNYEITSDADLQQIIAIGKTEDGQSHKMIMDYNGEVVEELIGDKAVNADGVSTDETGTTPPAQEGNGEQPQQPDSVQVPLSEYNKYHLSKKQQNFVEEQPESTDEFETFEPTITTTEERLIVEYERLPLKGTTPLVYSKVLETGEEIIFDVTLNQYANLGEKGTTVIQVTRAEGYGVKTIDQVTLVKWQD